MRVLVTGGTGFVGSHIVERLLDNGASVIVAKRETSNLRWLPVERVELIDAPIDSPEPLRDVLPEIDAVVHAAAITKARRLEDFHKINAESTRRLLELCCEHCPEIKRFVFVSSQAASCPGCDEDGVCENTPEQPISAYGKSKLVAECIVKEYADKLPVTILRPPTVYGPRDTDLYIYFRLVNKGFLPFAGDPDRQFSAVYVKDVASLISRLIRNPHQSGRTFFITDGEVHTWRSFGETIAVALGKNPRKLRLPTWALWPTAAIAESLARVRGKPATLSFQKVREMVCNWVCDDSLVRKEIGYESEYGLERGIEETANWYREMGWL